MSRGHLHNVNKIQTPDREDVVGPKSPSFMITKIGSSDPNIEPRL